MPPKDHANVKNWVSMLNVTIITEEEATITTLSRDKPIRTTLALMSWMPRYQSQGKFPGQKPRFEFNV